MELDNTAKLLCIDIECPYYLVIDELLYVIANIYYVVVKCNFDSGLAALIEIGICFVKIPGLYIFYVGIGANRELDQYRLDYLVFCSYRLKMVELVVYKPLTLLRRDMRIPHSGLRLYPQIRVVGVRRVDIFEIRTVKSDVVQVVLSRVYTKRGFGLSVRMVLALYAVLVKPLVQSRHILHIIHTLYVDYAGQTERVAVRLDVIFGILCRNKSVARLKPTRRVVPYIAYVFFFSELGGYGLRSGNLNLPVRRVVDKPAYAEFVVACFRRTEHLFAQTGRNNRFHLYPVVLQLYRRKIYLYKVHFAVFAVRLEIEYVYSVPGLQSPASNAVAELKLIRFVLVKANRINFAARIVQVSADIVISVKVVIFLVRLGEYSIAVVIPVLLVFAALITLCLYDYPYEISRNVFVFARIGLQPVQDKRLILKTGRREHDGIGAPFPVIKRYFNSTA